MGTAVARMLFDAPKNRRPRIDPRITIRLFEEEDAAALAAIQNEAFAPWIAKLPAVYGQREATPGDASLWARPGHVTTLLAFWQNAPAGYAQAALETDRTGPEGESELSFVSTDEHAGQSRIAVRPAFRCRGVGSALVESMLARHGDAVPFWVWVGAYGDSDAAVRVLSKLGFEQGELSTPCPFNVDPHHTDDSVLATYELTGPLPDAPEITGVVVREIHEEDVEDMRRVFGEARPSVFGPRPTREQILGWLRGGWGETILVVEREGWGERISSHVWPTRAAWSDTSVSNL